MLFKLKIVCYSQQSKFCLQLINSNFFHFLERKSVSSLTVIAAVAGVLGVVVWALIVALVVIYKRHHTQNAARAVYSRTSSEDKKQLVWEGLGLSGWRGTL